ncbi:MAG: FGGY-family carbohydrate kinase [Candidatus Moduliflexus flocculans]|nr:FGGY-family carbohydrate kinase [Candidatus Moduliflexus flocculans]
MPEAVAAYCRRTGQSAPRDEGRAGPGHPRKPGARSTGPSSTSSRTVLGHPIERIHVIGGGSPQRRSSASCTADATGLPVVAGPAEATAVGNILVQAMALGLVSVAGRDRGRIIRESFSARDLRPPAGRAAWDAAYARFRAILAA